MANISVVINTRNEEENLPRALKSVKGFAGEVIVVDMESTDKTVDIAKKAKAKVYAHKQMGYVEPARNFAISKAIKDWILILDADEEISDGLGKKLREIVNSSNSADFYRLPRKNIIFGKWIEHSLWWPDYLIRFFKKGKVEWSEIIHSVPTTTGRGVDLEAKEENAIVHYNYSNITEFIERLNRYTTIQAEKLFNEGDSFVWHDLIRKPVGEFVSRYFAGEGYKDGAHGLSLSLLQAFSELTVYLKVWEKSKFIEEKIKVEEINKEFLRAQGEFDHWLSYAKIRKIGILTKVLKKLLKL